MAHAGFTKSFIPAEYGRAGFPMLDFAIAAEELTRVDVNVPTTLLATGLGLQPVIQYGSPEQKERFLRPFADDPEGDLLASYVFTDVTGGANFDSPDRASGMQTIARRDGDEWVITGEKHYTTNLRELGRRAQFPAGSSTWCSCRSSAHSMVTVTTPLSVLPYWPSR